MIVVIAIAIYAACWLMLFGAFKKRQAQPYFKLVLPLAIAAHMWSASDLMFTESGVQLGFFQVASVFFAAMNIIVMLSALRKPTENLFLILLPFTCLALALSAMVFTRSPVVSDLSYPMVAHILLSIVAYSLLTLATLQALLLNYQNSRLKSHHVKSVIGVFPPLQTMESLLFDLVWAGFILLTMSIGTGVIFIEDLFAQQLSHKTVFSLFSWLLYAVLLAGRHALGWRGKIATRWVIAGFVMLMLAYFGSKFVIEIVMGVPAA